MLRTLSALSLCAGLITLTPGATTAAIVVVHHEDFAIAPLEVAPALAGLSFAYIGRDPAAAADAVYLGSMNPTANTPTPVLWRSQAAPNRPERKLDFFRAPAIVQGRVLIAAGSSLSQPEGLYLADADGLKTLVDCTLPGVPFPGDSVSEGPAWISASLIPAENNQWKSILAVGDRTPDGAVVTGAARSSIGGGRMVLATPIKRGAVEDFAIYATTDRGLRAVVTTATPPQPSADKFLAFHAFDTDGRSVAFVADQISDGEARTSGVYTHPLNAEASAPAALVARIGDRSPIGGTYKTFGSLAMDDGIVYFQATVAIEATERPMLLLSNGREVRTLLVGGSSVGARKLARWSFGPAGADRGRLLIAATFTDGTSGLIMSETAVCRADFNRDGGIGIDDLMNFVGSYVNAQASADMDGDGTISGKDLFEYLGAYLSGCRV